jgi:ribosomal protein S20
VEAVAVEKVTAMPESLARLRDQLDRWTAAGIIDAEQAARIESAERNRADAGAEKVVAARCRASPKCSATWAR